IAWGIAGVGRLFKELDVPLSVVLIAEFPGKHGPVWKEFRASQPDAPIIAHGMNNTNRMLPLERGLAAQKAYIRETLDLIAGATGVRPTGRSSPSVYSNGDTMQAIAAEGIPYTIDQMDFGHHFAVEDAGRRIGPTTLSGRHRRHGPASRAHEDARRTRDAVARLRAGVGRRGARRSRARGDDGGHWHPSLRHRDAGRRGRVAACSLAAGEGS